MRLGAEPIEMDGEMYTRDEALAMYLWKMALPRTEQVMDQRTGSYSAKTFDPEKWAIELLMDRKEGKSPNAVADDHAGPRVSDKVRDIAANRINALAQKVTKGPPKFVPKETLA